MSTTMTRPKTRKQRDKREQEMDRAVLIALRDSPQTFRTVRGLAQEIGAHEEEIRAAIGRNRQEVKRLSIPTQDGDSVYFLADRGLTFRDRLAVAKQYVLKSVP